MLNPSNLDEDGEGEVQLYVYDMSKGLANSLSQMFIGKHIDGIWHTGIVAYGREYFYGGGGIESCQPGGTVLGQPDRILKLGQTEVPYSIFLEYVFGLGESTYRPGTYDLFTHNCNNFSNEVATFLTGKGIPELILHLPQEILNSPLGESIRPLLESLTLRPEGSRGVSFGARAEEVAERRILEGYTGDFQREPSPKEDEINISEIKQKPLSARPIPEGKAADMESDRQDHQGSEEREPASSSRTAAADDDDEGDVQLTKKERKPREPPIVYTDINAAEAYETLNKHIVELLNDEEKQFLSELSDFVLADTGAWALGAQHLQMIGRVLQDISVPLDGRVALLKFLQAAALKDDIILLLHMDRKDHTLMNYINDFEKLEPEIQEALAKLICNLCLPATASDWLLYISEWQNGGQPCSNNRVTVRVAVNSLLSEKTLLQEYGVHIMYNLGLKEVFDDTATELSSAILQYLHNDMNEEYAFKLLTPLYRFMVLSYNDVPALVKMLGPDIGKFKGKSERVDKLVEQIEFKLSMVAAF